MVLGVLVFNSLIRLAVSGAEVVVEILRDRSTEGTGPEGGRDFVENG